MRDHRPNTLLLGCVCGAAIGGAAVFILPWSEGLSPASRPAPAAVDPVTVGRIGVLKLNPHDAALCKQFDFDNESNGIRYKGMLPCEDPPQPPQMNRMNAIRDSFRTR